MLADRSGRFEDALLADLGKPPTESIVTEIGFLRRELRHTRRHLKQWLRPVSATVPLLVGIACVTALGLSGSGDLGWSALSLLSVLLLRSRL